MTKKQEVEKKGSTEVTKFDYGEEAGTGFEGTTGSELSIPFITLLQSNSPQVEEKTVKGAETGALFDSVANVVFPNTGYNKPGLVVVPVKREHSFVEWTPRDQGGGFVARHSPEDDIVKAAIAEKGGGRVFGKLKTPDGNDLVQTFYVYVLVLDDEGKDAQDFAIVAFTSTKITPYKNWWTAMMKLKGNPPLFANRARLGSFPDKNKNGKFANFLITPFHPDGWEASLIDPQHERHLLEKAKDFRDMVEGGQVKVDFAREGGDADADEDASTPF